MATAAYHTQPAPPTPEEVLAFCETHTNAEAAAQWNITDRYVRKLKARARKELPPGATVPTVTVPNLESAIDDPPHFATVRPAEVARDGQMWKCPICGELMPPLPGTTGAEWAERGCYLHQAEPSIMSPEPEQGTMQNAQSDDGAPEQDRPPEHTYIASVSAVPGRPAEEGETPHAAVPPVRTEPAGELLEELSGLNTMGLNTALVRVIVRVPQERQVGGLVGWLATGPMLGPVPVWAILALAFGALLVQLGLL